MLTYNRVQILTRLTRDPEVRQTANSKVAKLGCVVDGPRKKDQSTGKWDSEPVWLDVEVWDRGENGRMASLCEERLSKGSEVFVDGRLKMDSWTDRDGVKRTKLLIVADDVRFLGQCGGGPATRNEESPPPPPVSEAKENLPF